MRLLFFSFFLSVSGLLCHLTAQVTPVAAVSDENGNIWAFGFNSNALVPGGGVVGIPSAAQNGQGDTYVAGIAPDGNVWLNIFKASGSWTGWASPGGPHLQISLAPAVGITPDGTVWIASLGAQSQGMTQQYWLIAYRPAEGFGEWIPLGTGVLQQFFSSPSLAVTRAGTIYVVAPALSREDHTETISIGSYVLGNGFSGWSVAPHSFVPFRGTIPSIAVAAASSEDAVYVASFDSSRAIWMARFRASGWGNWYTAPGVFSIGGVDFGPKIATGDGRIFAVGLDPSGGVWVNSFVEGTDNGWGSWIYVNGVLDHFAPAVVQNQLYIAGQSNDSMLWWYSAGNGWSPHGQVRAPGSDIRPMVAAAPD